MKHPVVHDVDGEEKEEGWGLWLVNLGPTRHIYALLGPRDALAAAAFLVEEVMADDVNDAAALLAALSQSAAPLSKTSWLPAYETVRDMLFGVPCAFLDPRAAGLGNTPRVFGVSNANTHSFAYPFSSLACRKSPRTQKNAVHSLSRGRCAWRNAP
jgi:hypothetical protein